MILRQQLPMAVRVNVVPMRRKRGLGDTCTPTNCPSGPYTDPNSNYNYWTLQSQLQGNQSGSQGQDLNPSQISAGGGSAAGPVCSDYNSCMMQFGPPALAASDFNTADVEAQAAAMNDFNTWYLTSPQSPHNLTAEGESTLGPNAPQVSQPVYATWPVGTQSPAATVPPSSQTVPATSQTSQGGGQQYQGSVAFSTPRSGALYPGDAWTIKIQGAKPNSPVAVTGNGSAATYGTNITTPMGTTDSSGNWALSGSIDSSQIGQWYENWSVGGQSVGSFSFTVQAAPSGGGSGAQQQSGGDGAAPTPTPTPTTGNWLTDSMFGGIPNWGLLAGAAVAVFAFSSGGKR
jgi:hypothetical protein